MSLIAWYPLDGNTLDYAGIYDATNNGAIVNNDGKIGKCYEFTEGTSQNIQTPLVCNKVFKDNQDFSLSLWFYLTSTPTVRSGLANCNTYYTNADAGGFGVGLNDAGVVVFCGDTESTTQQSISYTTFPIQTWHHICVRFSYARKRLEVFKNGELISSTTRNSWKANPLAFKIGNNTQGPWNVASPSKINDVRIYNHALSDKEIKEIARAKVLHYKFDDFQEPTKNLIVNGDFSKGLTSDWSNNFTNDGAANSYCSVESENSKPYLNIHWERLQGTSDRWVYIRQRYAAEAGATYTLSFEIRVNSITSNSTIDVRHSAVENDYWTTGRATKGITLSTFRLGTWNKVVLTRSFNSSYTNSSNGAVQNLDPCFEIFSNNLNVVGMCADFDIRNIQIEKRITPRPL